MTDDIIDRAQRALDELSSYDAAPLWEIVPALIDKLKAAQHTIERNQVALALRERELKAERAENERLREDADRNAAMYRRAAAMYRRLGDG